MIEVTEKLVKPLSKKELIETFKQALTDANITVRDLSALSEPLNFYKFSLEHEANRFSIIANIRNISDAYIPKKPFIKRRQVGPLKFEELPENKKNQLVMLVGIKLTERGPIFAFWNPYFFVGHATNRSCYILESSLKTALTDGFYSGEDCTTPVYACNSEGILDVIAFYIDEYGAD